MKKKLEAELISIAHRILKLKNKSELAQLHLETQKLYEKLSVLKFLEEQFDEVKPTIGRAEMEAKLDLTDIEEPAVAEMPSEPLRMTESEFVPIAVFMPEEVSEDRGPQDEEIEGKVSEIKSLELKEDEFVPISVFTPEEVSEDRGTEDEGIMGTSILGEQIPPMEKEFIPVAVFMPEEVSDDRGPEDEEIDGTTAKVQQETPAYQPEIEEVEETPKIQTPHVPEMSEIEQILAKLEQQRRAIKSEPAPEQEPEIIRHVLPMDEIEDEIEEPEAEVSAPFEAPIPVEVPTATEVPAPVEAKSGPKEISFADLLGHDFSEPVFERIDDIKSNTVETPVFEKSPTDFTEPVVSKEIYEHIPAFKADVPKTDHSHETHLKTITFGLNDKIGFEKHLFGGSSEEMNRVVSQLGSFNSFEEAKDFIEDMVKPDYNNWIGKEDYEQRFLEIIERRFA